MDKPRWWAESALIGLVYAAYSGGRLLARGDEATAVGHGLAILRFEERLGADAEHPLNRLFTDVPALGIPADFAYASLHYLVTPAILVWLFRRRPAHYRAARTWLMTATLLGLVGFTLLPTCPPRLLDPVYGFTDTMARYSAYGWWGGEASAPRGLGGLTNQFAAMPSLHVGWALWCGAMLWRYGRGPAAKAAGLAYPLVTTVVVLGTANHYLLDAVAGAAVMGLGLLLTPYVLRGAGRLRGTTEAPPVVSAGCETSAGERIPGQRSARTPADTSARNRPDPSQAKSPGDAR
ncbi:phosphatase PAP2 family protein [Streptomyces sp. NPDC094049]|uniref:phosphatase PAP2 family protein n=1 Tax=Streptomyces sp. NPDC094049 TaxID=3154987 RepID=UPI0033178E9A